MYVHGGGWVTGDKSNNIEDKVKLFRSLDYVFISTNYRLSPETTTSDPEALRHPSHSEDLADAIRWVYDHIDDYGGDHNAIALIGHSAGAQLVALTGANERFLNGVSLELSDISGIACIDTRGYNIAELVAEENETYINAFGDNPIDHQDASAIAHISELKEHPAYLIGKRGSVARINSAEEFISTLIAAGVEVFTLETSKYDHSGVNAAIGMTGEDLITPALIDFFDKLFIE